MTSKILASILGAAGATYLPRALPFLIGFSERLPARLRAFLTAMPTAALGALIFPAVLFSFPGRPAAGAAGVAAAAFVAWKRGGLVLPVIASVLTAWLILLIPAVPQ